MRRILIVDNSPSVRLALRKEIAAVEHGAEVRERDRVGPALEDDASWRPDVVFLGMILAGDERGITALHAMLRSRPERPVILCTGLPQDHPDVVEAVSLGAFASIPKPVVPAQVRHTLMQVRAYTGRFRSIS